MHGRAFGNAPLILAENPAPVPRSAEDPAVIAYRRWEAAREAALDLLRRDEDLGWDLHPLEIAETEAAVALARTIPTTPAGLALQLKFAFRLIRHLKPDRLGTDPDDYEREGEWLDNRDDNLLRCMLAGAQHMAGEIPDR